MFVVPELSEFVLELKDTVDDLIPELAEVINFEMYVRGILDSEIYFNDATILDMLKSIFEDVEGVDLSEYDLNEVMGKVVWKHNGKFEQIRSFICDLISYLQICLDSCRLEWTDKLAVIFEVDDLKVDVAGYGN